MRINFDFGDLEAFVAVSETGSFKRAADDLNISQSALSRRIQKLEEALGQPLIERTTRSMRLTMAAKAFRDRAVAILGDADEAVRAIGDDAGKFEYQRAQIVTVATVPTATQNILPRVIQAFAATNPHARIRISDLSANDVWDAVASGDADFGINFMGGQEPGLEFRGLSDDPFVLAVHRSDPLAGLSEIRWRDVDDSRFIAVWKGSGNRTLIDQALARSGRSMGWFCEVRHLPTALGFVETGLGITALPMSLMPARDHPTVAAVPLIEPTISRVLGTVKRQGFRMSATAESFHQLIIERWSEMRPNR
jgi:DNA-binding transcriptional LysR family regulator